MEPFTPERVLFDPSSLKYPLGRQLYEYFREKDAEIIRAPIQNVARIIPGENESRKYAHAKRTLVVTVKRSLKLEVCKPSADFEFSLSTGCPASCEYCYLYTTQSSKPYIRTYVNLEEIFESIKTHIEKNGGRLTTFEAASAGDPLALEHITGSLSKTIEFFGSLENGRLRVVTKYNNVDPLLGLRHNRHTRFRVSVNSRYVIGNFEHRTAGFEERLEAAAKLAGAGYPIGFVVAPIMIYDNWEGEYRELFDNMKRLLDPVRSVEPLTFELIQHRFTPVAKKFIRERFPKTKLDMDETKRVVKWGKFGRFKYVYRKDVSDNMRDFISSLINERFPHAEIEYFT